MIYMPVLPPGGLRLSLSMYFVIIRVPRFYWFGLGLVFVFRPCRDVFRPRCIAPRVVSVFAPLRGAAVSRVVSVLFL